MTILILFLKILELFLSARSIFIYLMKIIFCRFTKLPDRAVAEISSWVKRHAWRQSAAPMPCEQAKNIAVSPSNKGHINNTCNIQVINLNITGFLIKKLLKHCPMIFQNIFHFIFNHVASD